MTKKKKQTKTKPKLPVCINKQMCVYGTQKKYFLVNKDSYNKTSTEF